VVATGAPASAESQQSPQLIAVHGSPPDRVTLSRHTASAGRITFRIDSTMPRDRSSGILMFTLADHITLTQVFADFQEQFSNVPATRAKGTRDISRDAHFYGLADVVAGTPASVTQTLHAGTYYLLDAGALISPVPQVTTLRVHGSANRTEADGATETRRQATVYMTSSDSFISPRILPANGTIAVRNVSDTPHFMNIWPARPDTTDKKVQAWLDAGATGDSPFVDGPTIGLLTISPGKRAQLSYNLPPGTYVLFCEMPDDQTGISHVFMGMHKVVTLR